MLAAPPLLLLLLWAHLLRPLLPHSDWFAIPLAGLRGLAGLATAPWSGRVKTAFAAVCIVMGVLALPPVGLLAVCSTGDCI